MNTRLFRLITSAAILALAAGAEAAVELYVSPEGADSNVGTQAAPFATLEKARDVVRGITKDQSITVYLMPGDYRLAETLQFGTEDSGTAANPVTYKAYGKPGSARLSGGKAVNGWTDEGGGIYSAELPHFVHAVFENNVAGVVSREPDPGEGQAPIGTNLTESGVSPSSVKFREDQYTTFDYSDALLRIWPTNWQYQHFPITNIDFSSRVISFDGALWESGNVAVDDNSRFYLEHARAFIDEPGEFYVDCSTNKLYYMPRSGSIADQNILVPGLTSLLAIEGSGPGNRVHDLHFEGLALSDVDNGKPGPERNYTQGIKITFADSIEFRKMLIENAGDDGVFIHKSTSNIGIFDSEIRNSRYNGIHAYSEAAKESFVDQKIPLVADIRNITITNCAIYNVGNCAVNLYGTDNVEVSYCELYNCDRIGVYILVSSNCHIHHNDIHHVGLNYKDVAGGIYTNIIGRSHRFEDNRIHDVMQPDHDEGTPGKAIYLDYDGNADITVRNNVIYDVAAGMKIVKLGGERILFDNNILDDSREGGDVSKLEFWGGSHRIRWVYWMSNEIVHDRDMTLTNNVFITSGTADGDFIRFNSLEGWEDAVEVGEIPKTLTGSDHNLFYNADLDVSEYLICGYDIASWQALADKGYDTNSAFGSQPMFLDLENNDYRIAEGSPLHGLGTEELDAATPEGVGLRSDFPDFDLVTIEQWRTKHFEAEILIDPAEEALVWGDHADPDNDGIPNRVEYCMGLDPHTNDSDKAWVFTEGIEGVDTFTFNYRRSKSVPADDGVPQFSTDLVDWQPIGDLEVVDMGDYEKVVATVPVVPGDAVIFARLMCL